jgi:peptidoglycan/LPS O-acetylase OafA/YrhL
MSTGVGGVSAAVGCIGLTATWWLGPLTPRGDVVTLPVVLASAALLVVVAGRWRPAQRTLERPLPRRLGGVSFNLYLVHEPVVVSVALLLPPAFAWATLPISAPLALGLAALFHRWVEQPSHRLAKRVGRAGFAGLAATGEPTLRA